ncbi:hypothetical protein FOCC_FOCC015798 [Frankliniella occidentalis]|nr:hypothetical protein FOCC_FOCC015798 [Frankliniella occidentalis]
MDMKREVPLTPAGTRGPRLSLHLGHHVKRRGASGASGTRRGREAAGGGTITIPGSTGATSPPGRKWLLVMRSGSSQGYCRNFRGKTYTQFANHYFSGQFSLVFFRGEDNKSGQHSYEKGCVCRNTSETFLPNSWISGSKRGWGWRGALPDGGQRGRPPPPPAPFSLSFSHSLTRLIFTLALVDFLSRTSVSLIPFLFACVPTTTSPCLAGKQVHSGEREEMN